MRVLIGVVATAVFWVSGASLASPNYNYVELDYLDLDIEPFEGDGWAIGGSGLIHPNFYLTGRYSDAETDGRFLGTQLDADFQQLSVGIGAQSPLENDQFSVFGQLTFEDIELDVSTANAAASEDDTGFALEGGVRYMAMPQLELNGSARYIDVGDIFDGEFGFRAGALWTVLPWLAISVDYDQTNGDGGDVEQIQLGGRVYWDQLQ